MRKAIIWGRVSTTVQEIEAQVNELIDMAHSDGFTDYTTIKSSGASAICQNDLYKAEVDELIATIKGGEYDTVYVWEVSRLARVESTFHIIKEFLVDNKIQLIVKNPSLKLLNDDRTENLGVSLAFSMMASLARQEMIVKKARFKRGRDNNRVQGKTIGGGVTYGYTTDKDGYIVINEKEADVVKMIFNLYTTTDYGCGKIYDIIASKKLFDNIVLTYGGKSGKIAHILNNETYIGQGVLKYPALISQGVWNEAQKKIGKYHTNTRQTKHLSYGKGIVFSNEGEAIYPSANKNRYIYSITNSSINYNVIETAIWHRAEILYRDYYAHHGEEEEETIKQKLLENKLLQEQKEKEFAVLQEQKDRLNNLYVKGRIKEDAYDRQYKALEKQGAALQEDYNMLTWQEMQMYSQKIDTLKRHTVEVNDDATRCEIVQRFIRKVEIKRIDKNHSEITIYNKHHTGKWTYYYETRGNKATIKYDGEVLPILQRAVKKEK